MPKIKIPGMCVSRFLNSGNPRGIDLPLSGSIESGAFSNHMSLVLWSEYNIAGFFRQMKGSASPAANRKGLYLYKGTPPTAAVVNAYGATANSSNSATVPATFRASDLLLTYSVSALTVTGSTVALNLGSATASGSGSATWFCLAAYNGNTSTNSAYQYYPNMIVGTVTATNGGGDIEMPNVTVVSGNIYRMPQLELKLPFSYIV
jgi:hypothetical protein